MSCTVAMAAARSTASLSAAPHLVAAAAPGLHAQQRRDGLQVVLDPVVDLPDGRLLDAQLALAPPRLGEVVDEHQRAGGERDGAVAERAPGDLELRGQGAGGAEHGGDAERSPGQLGGAHARDPALDAGVAHDAHGVGRGVEDARRPG